MSQTSTRDYIEKLMLHKTKLNGESEHLDLTFVHIVSQII